MTHGKKRVLYIVLLIALVCRGVLSLMVATWAGTEGFMLPDSSSYLIPAEQLWDTFSFMDPSGFPMILRPPAYPLLILGGLILGFPVGGTLVLQVTLGVLAVYVIWRISCFLQFNRFQRILAVMLMALEPLSIIYSSKIMSETLFSLLLLVFVWTFVALLETPSWRLMISSSLLLAGATYVRPVTLYFPVVLGGFFLVLGWKRDQFYRWLRYGLVFLALFYGVTGIWVMRNYAVADYPHFSAVSDRTVYRYHAAAVNAKLEGTSYYDMRKKMRERELNYRDLPRDKAIAVRAKNYEQIKAEGVKTVLSHPIVYLPIHLKGMVRVMLDPGAVELLRMLDLYPDQGGLLGKVINEGIVATLLDLRKEQPLFFWTNVIIGLWLAVYLAGALVGSVGYVRENGFTASFVLIGLLVFYLWFLSGGPNSTSRFRHPMMPFLCLFAGHGLIYGWNVLKGYWSVELSDQSQS